MNRQAKAEVAQLRQQTQYTCCATSIAAALRAHGKNVSEDDVNRVLDASPMAGASWEAMLATVQYFGCRGTLVVPATPRMLKTWTDAGVPVVIAWNPEGRPWSHASTVYDVVEGEDGKLTVYVMDPNIPNPTETTRILGEDEFCQKWGEKVSESLIMRRPAMAVEREITQDGRQVMASTRTAAHYTRERRQEINHGIPRAEDRETWAEQRRYERSGQYDIDRIVSRADEVRDHLLNPWNKVFSWFSQYGSPRQRELSEWRSTLRWPWLSGRPRSYAEAEKYRDEIRTLQDIYDHPSGKGRELFDEVQRVLNLPTPLTPPPPGAERNLGVTEDAELRDKWERVVAYYSDLKGVAGNLERLLEAKLKRAIQDMPADLQGLAAGMNPVVKVDATGYGRSNTLGMAISQVGGYPEDIPDNLYTVVGYSLRCSITVGASHRGGWEAHMVFGVFPHLEESPKPRLLSAWVRYGRNKKDLLTGDLVHWGARVLYPWPIAGAAAINEQSTSESLTRADYEKAKTLTQSTGVIDAMFDSLRDEFAASAAAWVAEQEHEVRRREEARQAEEARRQREAEEARRQREEAARRQREKEEARRQRELERSQAKTVVDSALTEKLVILNQLIAGGFPQARDIAREVKSVYEAGGKPTEDQLRVLRNMMYRSRMRAEADHFRVASSDLEAAWWSDDVTARTAKVEDTVKIKKEDLPKHRHGPEFVQNVMRRPGGGTHHTRTRDVEGGRSRKEKHRKDWADREAHELTAAWGDT